MSSIGPLAAPSGRQVLSGLLCSGAMLLFAHSRIVEPASPVLRSTPPRGPDWLHEAKFDG